MSVRSVVIDQIQQVAEEQNVRLGALSDELPLLQVGLDSLGFAIIVFRLEETLGVDPFSQNEDPTFPVNVGDFVRIYERIAPSLP